MENKRWNVLAYSKTTLQTTLRTPPVDKVAKRRRFQKNGTQEKARLDLLLITFSASIFVELDFSRQSGIVV